ncbi:MAG: nucleoside kinase [Bacteroidales bacterium]|nr:nucleoside kinase [Bacteroidales bacterium]
MNKDITIYITNNNSKKELPLGLSLQELAEREHIELKYPIVGALVNNGVRDLSYHLYSSSMVNFFDITSIHGRAMYERSSYFLLFKAVSDLFPTAQLRIQHSISGGKYCEIENAGRPLDDDMVKQIKNRMRELVALNLPFERVKMLTEDAIAEYAKHGLNDKLRIFKYRNKIFTSVYKLDDKINYYYGFLLPSTGYINLFDLEPYENGMLMKIPYSKHPERLAQTRKYPKLFTVYQEYKKWTNRLEVPHVYNINEKIVNGEIGDFIKISEALHEKLLANIADKIHQKGTTKMVLISGPSSSGKTTSCKRLSIQLSILGYHPVQISLDNFFVERAETPKDKDGNYDFECLEALDLKLFHSTMERLIAGEEVELPYFNFSTGSKEWRGEKIKLQENSILVLEGIHCLNPKLTENISDDKKFKIFVSALTSVSIDNHNPIPTTDNRLIRRIVRDSKYRNYSALDTLRRWPSVRAGEERNIFPFQENADVMFNSSLLCELGVLKAYAVPVLKDVPETAIEYAEAQRLLKFLSYFKTIPEKDIPSSSILREFVGGSNFHY